MPGWIGTVVADEIYNFLYRGTAITIGADLYIRFLVSPSSRTGGGTETNYAGYARYQFTRGTTLFGPSSGGRITNQIEIELPTANSLGNGDLAWFDIVDTASGAFTKLYNGGPILPPRTLVVGKAPVFGVGKLICTI